MAQIAVTFTFHSGVKRQSFRNVRLSGSWNAAGQFSNQWTETPMAQSPDETGCDAFRASVSFDDGQTGTVFHWGVMADIVGAPNTWVVVTEVPDENSNQRTRSFALTASGTQQDYWFATGRRFGAQKYLRRVASRRFVSPFGRHMPATSKWFSPRSPATGTPTGYIAMTGLVWIRRLRSCPWCRTRLGRAACEYLPRSPIQRLLQPPVHVPHHKRAGRGYL